MRPGSTGPVVRFQLICPDGYPEVDEVRIVRSEGDAEISATTLQSIPLKKIKEDAITTLGLMAYGAKHEVIEQSQVSLIGLAWPQPDRQRWLRRVAAG